MAEQDQCTCGNCGRVIGALEQPYQWGDYLLCYECACRISQQQAAQVEHQQPPPADPIIFRYKAIRVRPSGVYDQEGCFDMHLILSVQTVKSFAWGYRVRVFDLSRRYVSYWFPNTDTATRFIAAIQSVKGFINVESEGDGWFFFFWW